MFDPSKSLKKMLGNGLQVPRMMTGVKGPNDWDGDGIANKIDCQPRNLIRQDKKLMTWAEFQRLHMGHEAPPLPGEEYSRTVGMRGGFIKNGGKGMVEASCPKCGIKNQVVRDTGKIVEHKKYGEHILIKDSKGNLYDTKNINPIGSRTIRDGVSIHGKNKKPDIVLNYSLD